MALDLGALGIGGSIGNFGPLFSLAKMKVVVIWTVILAGLGVAVFYLGRATLFKYKVIIIEKRGRFDQVIGTDTARVLRKRSKGKDKGYFLKLAKAKQRIPVTDFKYVRHLKGSFFQKQVIFLYKFGEQSYTPVDLQQKLNLEGLKLTPVEANLSELLSIMAETDEKFEFKEFWDQYGQLIISGLMFGVLIIMLILTVNGIKANSSALAASANAFKEAAQVMSQCQAQPVVPGFGG